MVDRSEGDDVASGGVVLGPDGSDSIPVRLLAGEHVYDANGKLLFVAPPDESEPLVLPDSI